MLNSDLLNRYQNVTLLAAAFTIPLLPTAAPFPIALFTILSILNIVKTKTVSRLSPLSISLILFYLLHIVWLIGTENMGRGLFIIEVKLVLLVVPLAFLGYSFKGRKTLDRIQMAFVIGAFIHGLICLGQSSYRYYLLNESHLVFYTSGFSFMMHPSYLAVYLNLAIGILYFNLWREELNLNWILKILSGVTILLLSLFVFLAASKVGILMWAMIVLIMISYAFYRAKNKLVPFIGLAIIVVFLAIIRKVSAVTSERLGLLVDIISGKTIADNNSTESTAVRVLVYKTDFALIAEHPWLGQGSGDFRDALIKAYENRGYMVPAKKHYNAHNLFFESWIALGIIGFLSSVSMFVFLFYQAIKSKNKTFISFGLLFLLLSLFECSLSIRLGIMFFSFFAVLYGQYELSVKIDSNLETD